MLAHAFLAVATAAQRDAEATAHLTRGDRHQPPGLIEVTVAEFRRLFDALLTADRSLTSLFAGRAGADDIKPEPEPPTDDENNNDHELRLSY